MDVIYHIFAKVFIDEITFESFFLSEVILISQKRFYVMYYLFKNGILILVLLFRTLPILGNQ